MTRQPPLSLEEQEYIERKVKRTGPSKLASYLLWFFFGVYGIHRFYTGAIKTGIAMLFMHLLGITILIGAFTYIMASGFEFSTFIEYVECIEDNPYDHKTVCEPYYQEQFEAQFQQNWGEDGPDIPVATLTVGGILFGGSILWWLVDVFLVPWLVNQKNRQLRHKYVQEVLRYRREQGASSYEEYPQQPRQ